MRPGAATGQRIRKKSWRQTRIKSSKTSWRKGKRFLLHEARALKSNQGADSVMLMFTTHDVNRSYAVGPDQGYADNTAIGYWGVGSGGVYYFSQPFDYEHEALHLCGAWMNIQDHVHAIQ